MRFEFAKPAAETELGLAGIAIILSRIASGEFGKLPSKPDYGPQWISAARLIALSRGDDKVRPVAVGDC